MKYIRCYLQPESTAPVYRSLTWSSPKRGNTTPYQKSIMINLLKIECFINVVWGSSPFLQHCETDLNRFVKEDLPLLNRNLKLQTNSQFKQNFVPSQLLTR